MLNIRKATKKDMLQYFHWANDPEVRKTSFHSRQIALSEHKAWFESKINNPSAFLYVFEENDSLIGQVRIEKSERAVLSISIDKNFRGKGFAVTMLKMAIENFHKTKNEPVFAYIRKDNTASIKSFQNAGFEYFEERIENGVECLVYIFREKQTGIA